MFGEKPQGRLGISHIYHNIAIPKIFKLKSQHAFASEAGPESRALVAISPKGADSEERGNGYRPEPSTESPVLGKDVRR